MLENISRAQQFFSLYFESEKRGNNIDDVLVSIQPHHSTQLILLEHLGLLDLQVKIAFRPRED